jgi:hypothetical protein
LTLRFVLGDHALRRFWDIDAAQALVLACLTSASALQVTGALTLASGSLTDSAGVTVNGGAFAYDGGTLSSAVRLQNAALTLGATATSGVTFTVLSNSTLSGDIAAGQEVLVQGGQSGQDTTLTTVGAVQNAGTIRLQSAGTAAASNLTITGGTLTNTSSGALDIAAGSGGGRHLNGGSLVNQGTLEVDPSVALFFGAASGESPALTQAAGTITSGSGGAVVLLDGSFVYTGGSISGGEFIIVNSSIDVASSVTSAATVEVRGAGNTLLENASPAVTLAVQSWSVDGDARLTAVNGAVNAGTISLISTQGTIYNSDLAINGTLTSTGTINAQHGTGGNRHIDGGTLVNQGAIAVDPGVALFFGAAASETPALTQAAGSITSGSGGALVFLDGSFVYTGGSISGGEFIVVNSSIDVASSVTSPATVEVRGTGNTLLENASPVVTLVVQSWSVDGDARLSAVNGSVNAGTITLISTQDTWHNSDLAITGTLTNTGTINAQHGTGGNRHIDGGTLVNQGALNVDAGVALFFGAAAGETPALTQAAGSIASGSGGAVILLSGSIAYTGGTINGEFIVVNSSINVTATMATPTTIEVRGSGNTFIQNTAPLVTLWVQSWSVDGDARLTATDGAVNAGTIRLDETQYWYYNSDLVLAGTLTNTGVISATAGTGGNRHIYGGTLVNQGSLAVDPGVTLFFSPSGNNTPTFNQQAGLISSGSGGSVVFTGGNYNFSGGTISGEFTTVNSALSIASSVTSATTVEVRGQNSTLVQNAAPVPLPDMLADFAT